MDGVTLGQGIQPPFIGHHQGHCIDAGFGEEMVDQIATSATFKANVKVIKANDEMLGSLIDIKK